SGLLCTIDVANDPAVVYDSLVALDPPRIDFLLPHATWDDPPPNRTGEADERYADWLIAIFDRWLDAGRPVGIRTFDSIISTLAGGESLTEALGLRPAVLAVIETDGSYEQVDSLKTAFDGAPATGLNVFGHSLDVVAQHPGITARQQGLSGLCRTCQECPVVTSCGGGLYTHRYGSTTGFANPSVYCADLLKLITHISDCLPQMAAGQPEAEMHVLSGDTFNTLASGFGDAAAISQLIESQQSLRRVLLGAVYQVGITTPGPPDRARAALRAAWAVLTAIDGEQPQVLDAVLAHPYVRVWAVRCLEQLRPASDRPAATNRPPSRTSLAVDLSHLGAIAAVAAIRASAKADVTVPVVDGAIHFPTLGRLVVGRDGAAEGEGGEPQAASVVVADGVITIRAGGSQWEMAVASLLAGRLRDGVTSVGGLPADWHPVRVLRAPGISVAVEDTDPYRDCHQWSAAPRLTDDDFALWQRSFEEAWDEILRHHAAYAPALAAGLSVLMPLSAGPQGKDVSATARQAFGAVAAALPADPVILALLIIHEFQHVKLGAVLDLYDLYDPADDRLFHAPWRDDLRPLEGLLQGTYAHLAVSDFWRARREVTAGADSGAAGERFAFWHAHTCAAVDTLTNSGSLTPLGVRFVSQMRRSLRS
ncbi:MAG: HEXXH motif-containing putative peptide modification protein, partial [Streptosporangiaceae bacterium]